jgi:hypothetical protein
MFYNNEEENYRDIEDISMEDLSKRVGVTYNTPTNNQEEWATFSFLRGMEEFDDEVYASCFMYYITVMMTGWGVSNAAEYTYFKESLEDRIFDILEDVREEQHHMGGTHKEAMQGFFQQVIEFFKEEGEDYEKAVYKYTANLTEKNKEKITSKGSIKEVIINGLDNAGESVANHNSSTTITFVLTYSQSKLFDAIEGESATEKVLRIIGGLE